MQLQIAVKLSILFYHMRIQTREYINLPQRFHFSSNQFRFRLCSYSYSSVAIIHPTTCSCAVLLYSLGGFRKRHAKERLRQALRVHLHAGAAHVVVLPLRHVRRLSTTTYSLPYKSQTKLTSHFV